MLGVTSDGKFKPLRIRELDNDDVDSTDEDTPAHEQHWPMSCACCGAV